MICPQDGTQLDRVLRQGVEFEHCPTCGGVWLQRAALDKVIAVASTLTEPDEPGADWRGGKIGSTPRAKRYDPSEPKKPKHFEERKQDTSPKAGKSSRFGGTYSRKAARKNALEEIFDFD